MAVTITGNDGSRYRGLIISIAAFLTLIGALLAFTFYTSSILERNTTLVNISNKTANDAQSVIKDLFDLESSVGENINSLHQVRVRERLETNTQDINKLLAGMRNGSSYTDANDNNINIPQLTTEYEQGLLDSAQKEWDELNPLIINYLDGADDIRIDSSSELALAYEQAKTSSLRMNDSLDELTDEVYAETEQQADTIRLVQLLGVAAIFAYFFIFIVFFVRRLRETDAEALAARRETQEIMETVNTGLFLLDKDLNIGQQHSRALANIIGTESLAGENFTNVLRGRISDKDLTTTRQFIEQLYNPRVKEKLVDSLNPLQKVMLHNNSADQGTGNRFLDFKFSRVYENKDIARILVNVNDVSDAVYLEQRLEKERSQNDMQVEMLTTILNVKPKIINEFINNTKSRIEKINNVLKNPGSSQHELERKLNAIYRDMHSLKGESSALKLHSFTKIASDAEDKLQALQNQGELSGNDFLPLTVQLNDLLSLSNTIEKLGERINQASSTNNKGTNVEPIEIKVDNTFTDNKDPDDASEIIPLLLTNPITDADTQQGQDISLDDDDNHLLSYYQDFAQDIASRQGKQVHLNSETLAVVKVPNHLRQTVKEISIQLLRNAVVHGIEVPKVRQSIAKPTVGSIELKMQDDGKNLILIIQDDGQGINYDSIRDKLVAMGRFSTEEVQQVDRTQLLQQLFSSGFSTKDDADEDGGRGVGLDIIKEEVRKHNGKLNVNSQSGQMTRFTVTLPKAS